MQPEMWLAVTVKPKFVSFKYPVIEVDILAAPIFVGPPCFVIQSHISVAGIGVGVGVGVGVSFNKIGVSV
jgi:hypothetical protein